MIDQWEILDLYKALLALAAGVILGLERELKDKAAGLKTISVITLGAALFSMISYKLGQPNGEATRIASYVVSGIGFLGAGVIFKDGANVSGLTTASVIWLAAAIGMAIGFGEMYLAAIFLVSSLFLIYFGGWVSRRFPGAKVSKQLRLVLPADKADLRDSIVRTIYGYASKYEEKLIQKKQGHVVIVLELLIRNRRMDALKNYLFQSEDILEFEL